jgi:hypothetical protein
MGWATPGKAMKMPVLPSNPRASVATAAARPCVASVADGRAVGVAVVGGGPHAPASATTASAMNAPILRRSSTTGRP